MDLIEILQTEADTVVRKAGRPLVTLTYAQSLDGCITLRRGQPLAISGKGAQLFTHSMRAAHDAILVGIGTVLADNPLLTVRLVEGRNPQPVVLDSKLRFPLSASLLKERPDSPPWIATTRLADPVRQVELAAAGAQLLTLPADKEGHILLPALLKRLARMKVKSLMVEGGARVITSFLVERLVDWVAITVAPVFLGGLHAVQGETEEANSPSARVFPRLSEWGSERVGDDLIIWGAPVWEDE